MKNKLKRIILDIEDLMNEPYIDSNSKEELQAILDLLNQVHIYSTDI